MARQIRIVRDADSGVTKASVKEVDFDALARGIAWRAAHALDAGIKAGDRSLTRFVDGLRHLGVTAILRIPDGADEPRGVAYRAESLGLLLDGSKIAPELAWAGLKTLGLTWTPEEVKALAARDTDTSSERIPEKGGGLERHGESLAVWNRDWFWNPNTAERNARSGPIKTALAPGGLDAAYPRKTVGGADGDVAFLRLVPLLTRVPDDDQVGREHVRAGGKLYWAGRANKTYVGAGDGNYDRVDYDDTYLWRMERVTTGDPEQALRTVSDAAVVAGSDLIELDRSVQPRLKDWKLAKRERDMHVADPASGRQIPGVVATIREAARQAFGEESKRFSDLADRIERGDAGVSLMSSRVPTLKPVPTRLIPGDIDKIHLPDGLDGVQSVEAALKWFAQRLPPEFRGADAILQLSASAGFAVAKREDGTTGYVPSDNTPILNAHPWFVSDRAVRLKDVSLFLQAHDLRRQIEAVKAGEEFQKGLDTNPISNEIGLVYSGVVNIVDRATGTVLPDPLGDRRWQRVRGERAVMSLPEFDHDALVAEVARLKREVKALERGREAPAQDGRARPSPAAFRRFDPLPGAGDADFPALAAAFARFRADCASRIGDDQGGYHTVIPGLVMVAVRRIAESDPEAFRRWHHSGMVASDGATRRIDGAVAHMCGIVSDAVRGAYVDPGKRVSADDYAMDLATPGSGRKLSELVSGAAGKLAVEVARGALRAPVAVTESTPSRLSDPEDVRLVGRALKVHIFGTREEADARRADDPHASVAVLPPDATGAQANALATRVSEFGSAFRVPGAGPCRTLAVAPSVGERAAALLDLAVERVGVGLSTLRLPAELAPPPREHEVAAPEVAPPGMPQPVPRRVRRSVLDL